MGVTHRLTDGLLGSIVAVLTAPTGIGAALGGWLAARRAESALGGALTGAVVGLLAALPWGWLVYLASSGGIDHIGYHEDFVHVGVNPAAPETLVFWQEVSLAVLCGGIFFGTALVGGLLATLGTDIVADVREELATAV
jgi:4-amino-4-deoxy-L-arabinose transferase-like glycosyltransferase